MGEYADIKRKRMKSFLRWLSQRPNISIVKGGKHQYNIKHDGWERPYPIPFKHGVVNKHIVKKLMKKLVGSGICTKEEFDGNIK